MRKRYVVISVLCVAVCLFMTAADVSARSLTRSDFRQIARTGFEAWGGDSANSYSWGVGWFNNDLYVGTVRHHLWSLGVGLSTMFPIGGVDLADPPSVTTWGDPAYADEMAGQIWRFRDNTWEMVHKSGTFILPVQIQIPIPGTDPVQFFTIPAGTYPIAYGYRTVGEFDGYLYACGVGTWIPPMPKSSVVRSRDTGGHDQRKRAGGVERQVVHGRFSSRASSGRGRTGRGVSLHRSRPGFLGGGQPAFLRSGREQRGNLLSHGFQQPPVRVDGQSRDGFRGVEDQWRGGFR